MDDHTFWTAFFGFMIVIIQQGVAWFDRVRADRLAERVAILHASVTDVKKVAVATAANVDAAKDLSKDNAMAIGKVNEKAEAIYTQGNSATQLMLTDLLEVKKRLASLDPSAGNVASVKSAAAALSSHQESQKRIDVSLLEKVLEDCPLVKEALKEPTKGNGPLVAEVLDDKNKGEK